MKKILRFIQTNGLFIKVVSAAISGIIILAVLITWIAVYTLRNDYMRTFRHSYQTATDRIQHDIGDFYSDVMNVTHTVKTSWAFRRYLSVLDMNSSEASYTIYSMGKHIDSVLNKKLESDINILVVGVNGRTYISGSSNLAVAADEILESDFTDAVRQAKGLPVISYLPEGYTTAAMGNSVCIIGSSITYREEDIPYGYVFVIIPQKTLSGFYNGYSSDNGEILLIQNDGTVLSSDNSKIIGTVQPEVSEALSNGRKKLRYNGKTVSAAFTYVPQLECYAVKLIDREQTLKNSNVFSTVIFVSVIISMLLIAVMFLLIRRSVRPIYSLIQRMSKTDGDEIDLDSKIEPDGGYETRELARVYNLLLDDINSYIAQLVSEQADRRKAEIHALQMQINPHFMYNTLASIKWLIWQGENEKSVKAIDSFIMILRNTISNKNEMITVDEEAENLRNYVFLLSTRFSYQIHTDIFVTEQCGKLRIPKLLVQPFVENSFYHAFNDSAAGIIHVFFRKKGENLIIEVIDNGSGIKNAPSREVKKDSFTGIGIHNVDERIHLIYGDEYGVEIESDADMGTHVTIVIPAEE